MPSNQVKDVIGVKGMNVRAIKTKSGTLKIGIQEDGPIAKVTLTGTDRANRVAQNMVLSIAAGDQTCIGNVTESLEIDQKHTPKLIGSKGTTITELKNATGAYIQVREVEPDGHARRQASKKATPPAGRVLEWRRRRTAQVIQ